MPLYSEGDEKISNDFFLANNAFAQLIREPAVMTWYTAE
jgi:hypothetical protein